MPDENLMHFDIANPSTRPHGDGATTTLGLTNHFSPDRLAWAQQQRLRPHCAANEVVRIRGQMTERSADDDASR